MGRHLVALLLWVALSTCQTFGSARAQDAGLDQMPPVAPTPSVVPTTPFVMPPDVPPRPPLQIRTVATSAPISDASAPAQHKPPLAWRARAHKLRQSNSAAQVVLQTNYDNAIMQLIAALGQAGLRVDTLNSKAGELLAVPLDSRISQRYVFVFAEMPPNTVTIKVAAWSQTKTSAATIDTVLNALRGVR